MAGRGSGQPRLVAMGSGPTSMMEKDRMSSQMEFFANLIESAEKDDDEPLLMLRQICVSSAEIAPRAELIKIAKFIYGLGVEIAKSKVETNT